MNLSSDTALVAAREVRERLRSRAFRVVTAVLLLAVAAAILVPEATRSPVHRGRIGIVGSLAAAEKEAVLSAVRSTGTTADLVTEPSRGAAYAALRSGRIDLAVASGKEIVVDKPFSASDTSSSARLVRAVASALGIEHAFAEAGLTPAQARAVSAAAPLPVTSVEPPAGPGKAIHGASIVGVIIVFIMLTQYETWTLIGVMEEKSSRVVEVLLATVRPTQLLGGKLLGIGITALAQATAVLGFALALAGATGSDLLKGAATQMLGASLLWLILGYAFYSWVYAAAGSLVERQEQVQTLALPLTMPMILGYVMALVTAGAGHPSAFFDVLAYLPPTAPFAMPVLVGLGAVAWWGFALSVLVSLLGTLGAARLAVGIYRRAVLNTGRRVRLRELLAR